MSRRLLAAVIAATGLVCGAFAWTPTRAEDKEESPGKKVDQVLQSYESRTGQDLGHTRKEIARLRKELTELIELRYDMAISLAELKAEQRAANPVAGAEGGISFSGQPARASEQDQQQQRGIELARELRQVQELLRTSVQQARTETDQAVVQLRTLRAQERQRQEQLKSDRERGKEGEQKEKGKEGSGKQPASDRGND